MLKTNRNSNIFVFKTVELPLYEKQSSKDNRNYSHTRNCKSRTSTPEWAEKRLCIYPLVAA